MMEAERDLSRKPKIAFFVQDLDGGGAERALVSLAGAVARDGYAVDLVAGEARSDLYGEIPAEVNLVSFATRSPLRILPRLVAYLREQKPKAVMSALDLANIMLVIAARVSGHRGRVVVSQRAVVDASLNDLRPLRRVITKSLLRISMSRADAVISNSFAATNDVKAMFGIDAGKVITIPNAVDVERIGSLGQQSIRCDFAGAGKLPLIVSVGSLSKRKDVPTLLRAFKTVATQKSARLVVVGEGPERASIERLIAELGLTDAVHLTGFDANPYGWMAAATVFVSASTGEGFPNVIAEALALGRPVVATDCPGDTAELLEHGKWGRLVAVGDHTGMAAAILAALDGPNPPDGRMRAADFAPSKTTASYLDVLLGASARSAVSTRGSF